VLVLRVVGWEIFKIYLALVVFTMSVLTICEPILTIDRRSSEAQIVSPIREAFGLSFQSPEHSEFLTQILVRLSGDPPARRCRGATSKPAPKLESLSYVELLYSSPNRLVVRHRHVEAATSII
jgi:hypothetical protein